jgi:glycosyltransferase involved in cell wall biosynthesis
MTALIDILIPTLWRGDRLPGLVENIHRSTLADHAVLFVAELDDLETIEVLKALSVEDPRVRYVLNTRTKNCCGAFNSGHEAVTAPYWFAGGDDLTFHQGWDVPCLAVMQNPELGAKIVGTRDLYNPNVEAGWTATHFLVDTGYSRQFGLTFDEVPGLIACESYGHDFFDTESCAVATTRGVFQPCMESIVEHQHWCFGKANVDATYQRNQELCGGDRIIFDARKEAWEAKYAA